MSPPLRAPLTDLDLAAVREQFPALQPRAEGPQVVCLDNPAGTQVPRRVISAVAGYLEADNANTHGAFGRSQRTDGVIGQARACMATLLGAESENEIAFGPNMTTLTLALSRAIARSLQQGDEVIVSDLDHDANIAPWLALEERGVRVRRIPLLADTCTLDLQAFERLLGPRTQLVAVGLASNVVGTVNDVPAIAQRAHAVGASVWVDAVHFAPHGPIDVQALGADFLVCSAYKFFGPHVGVLWGKAELLERIEPYQVRPAPRTVPEKFETGTKNHECLAGLIETVRYLGSLTSAAASTADGSEPGSQRAAGAEGASPGEALPGRALPSRDELPTRASLVAAMDRVAAYEARLSQALLEGLACIPGVRVYGLGVDELERRVPTVSLTIQGMRPADAAAQLAERGICAWGGHHYAPQLIESLGLREEGGLLRLGAVHYNTLEEIERTLAEVEGLARGR